MNRIDLTIKIRNWILIGTILNGCIAVLSAFITVVEIVLAILGMQYAQTPVANDYMAFGKIITQALATLFVVLAPFVAVMAGVVFALSLISCLLGASSLKKHRNLPYSMADLENTTGRILCNGILALGYLLMLFSLKFYSVLVIGIAFIQVVICILQVKEMGKIRALI